MELEAADSALEKLYACQVRIEQLLAGALQAHIPGAVGRKRKIHPDRPNRRSVPDPESHRLNHVVEILVIPLLVTETYASQVTIDVSGVVKEYTTHIVAQQWKSEFEVTHQQCLPAKRETCEQVARTRLVIGEPSMRSCTTSEESLG
jgi:hypothetical protein